MIYEGCSQNDTSNLFLQKRQRFREHKNTFVHSEFSATKHYLFPHIATVTDEPKPACSTRKICHPLLHSDWCSSRSSFISSNRRKWEVNKSTQYSRCGKRVLLKFATLSMAFELRHGVLVLHAQGCLLWNCIGNLAFCLSAVMR